MKKPLILMLCTAILAVTSCGKLDNSGEIIIDPPVPGCFNTKITEDNFSGKSSADLTYDDQGRTVLVKSSEGFTVTYVYSKDKIVSTTKEAQLGATIVNTYNLDANGRITSDVLSPNYRSEYTYDSKGYMTEIKEITANPTQVHTKKLMYTDGNLTSITENNTVTTFTYGNELNRGNFLISADIEYPEELTGPLKNYYGTPSKNLFNKISSSDSDGTYNTYTYQRDNKENIIKMTGGSVPAKQEKAFTITSIYTCK